MSRGCHAERPVQQSFAIDGCLSDDSPLEDVFAVWVSRIRDLNEAIAARRAKRTDELVPGDRLRMPRNNNGAPIIRTVSAIERGPYLNRRNEPIYNVKYAELDVNDGWNGYGNSGIASTEWELA